MRVLIVSPYHFPGDGVATYASNLSELLKRNGHETAFFAMQDDRNIPDPNSDLFVSHIDYVELNRRKSFVAGLTVLGRVIYSREARRKFGQLIDRFHPDVVHTQGFHHFTSPSILYEANKRHIPVVHTLHDRKMICPNTSMINDRTGEVCEACKSGRYYMPILKRCKKGSLGASAMASIEAYAHRLMGVRGRVSAYISPSEFLLDKFIEHGFPRENLYHIPNMLPEEAFVEGHDADGYMLFIGRVDVLKGVRELIQAAKLAPEVRVKIAGRIAPSMEAEVPAALPPNVEYIGLKSGEELHALVANSLAIVVPSTSYETQPFSVLAAFAAAKPVIGSDLGGIPELVKQPERGMLVQPGSVEELAEAMLWMWSHPEETHTMGNNARQYVRMEHSLKEHYRQIMELYNSVAKVSQTPKGAK